jgi:hypothetical protein
LTLATNSSSSKRDGGPDAVDLPGVWHEVAAATVADPAMKFRRDNWDMARVSVGTDS